MYQGARIKDERRRQREDSRKPKSKEIKKGPCLQAVDLQALVDGSKSLCGTGGSSRAALVGSNLALVVSLILDLALSLELINGFLVVPADLVGDPL